jgi:hypothetical protein
VQLGWRVVWAGLLNKKTLLGCKLWMLHLVLS